MTPSRDIGRLIEIMAALRTPETGCPWDLEQNFATIAPYTLEEAYEVADAIARGDLADLEEELGDLLLQVVFHARMAQEQGAFDFGDVVEAITDKADPPASARLWRRRGARPESGQGPVGRDQGAREKADEDQAPRGGKPADDGALAGVPVALPALTRALKLQDKASKVGFDWNDPRAVLRKIREEADEIEAALDARQCRARRPKSAICCSPPSISRAILTPIRKRCCGRPTGNSSAVLRAIEHGARRAGQGAAGRHARRNGCALERGEGAEQR